MFLKKVLTTGGPFLVRVSISSQAFDDFRLLINLLSKNESFEWLLWFRNCIPQFSTLTKTMLLLDTPSLFPLPPGGGWRGELEVQKAKIMG